MKNKQNENGTPNNTQNKQFNNTQITNKTIKTKINSKQTIGMNTIKTNR